MDVVITVVVVTTVLVTVTTVLVSVAVVCVTVVTTVLVTVTTVLVSVAVVCVTVVGAVQVTPVHTPFVQIRAVPLCMKPGRHPGKLQTKPSKAFAHCGENEPALFCTTGTAGHGAPQPAMARSNTILLLTSILHGIVAAAAAGSIPSLQG
jgi:hypothetical protein